jgi:hypothetical protein
MSQMILEYDEFCMFLLNIEVYVSMFDSSFYKVIESRLR